MSPIISGFALLLTCLALPIFAYANDTMALTDEPILQFGNNTWLDDTRDDAKNWLNHTAQHVDGWFGVSDLDEPAHASIRLMLDTHYNEYDGTTVKPRIRGRIKLPTLENRLSVMIGDDKLDLEHGGGIHNDGRAITYGNNALNRRQNREDNTSLALRWSKFQNDIGVDTDADIGLRSDDLYLKLHAQKKWNLDHRIHARFEQMYRYGTKSEHYALSTLEFSQPQSKHRTLINRTHLSYTHKDTEESAWGNSLYQQHHLDGKHGTRTFGYGIYTGGDVVDKRFELDVYGPYASYRQPIWRKWLFMQTDVSYYNNKDRDRDHHLGIFNRLEMVF